MSYVPVDVPAFGGLDVGNDAEDSRGALDIKNLSLSDPSPSRLVTRPGYALAGTLDLSAVTGFSPVGSSYLMGGATNLQLVAAAGTQTATGTFTTGDPWSVAPVGSASALTLPTYNGSLTSNDTGWSAASSTATRDTGVYNTSPASERWDNTGASDNLGVNDRLDMQFTGGTFYAGVPYTAYIVIRPSAAVASTLTIRFGPLATYTSGTLTMAASATWQTFGITWTPSETVSAVTCWLTLLVASTSGCYYNVDDVDVTSPGSAYAANGAAIGVLRVDGTTIATPKASTKASSESVFTVNRAAPKPYALVMQPKDNRLVAWGFAGLDYGPNGESSSGSHAYFAQPDNPEQWDETDYVMLSPGDGETGRAACAWNDYTLLFKQSKFFVFYGNSTDADGGAVFNYRTVANAFGGSSSAIYQGQVCSAPSGVYVITDTGVWKTTGGQPALVSGALAPLFNTNLNTRGYDGSGLTRVAPRSATGSGGSFWHEGCVWFSVTLTRGASTTSSGWLVFDESSGEWVVYEFADTPRVGASSGGSVVFPSGLSTSGRKGLLSMDGTATTDNGTAISWYYVSPYSNLGSAVEKRVRQTELHGSGTCDVSWGKDLQSHGYARSVTMLNGRGLDRTAVRGESLSWKVAGSGAFRLNRVIPFVADQRASGVKT